MTNTKLNSKFDNKIENNKLKEHKENTNNLDLKFNDNANLFKIPGIPNYSNKYFL